MANLKGLFPILRINANYKRCLNEFKNGIRLTRVSVTESARSFLLSCIFSDLNRPLLILASKPERVKDLVDQMALWLNENRLLPYPEPEALPYQRVTMDRTVELETIRMLSTLIGRSRNHPSVTIVSIDAFSQYLPDPVTFAQGWLTVGVETEFPPLDLIKNLDKLGYHLENLTESPGTYSRRGGVIDVFPVTEDEPIRIEYFGNTIESLRIFDPVSQRSSKRIDYIEIGPATLIFAESKSFTGIDLTGIRYELMEEFENERQKIMSQNRPDAISFWAPYFNRASLLDYVPANTMVIIDEPELINRTSESLADEAECLRKEKASAKELPFDYPLPYITFPILENRLLDFQRVELVSWGTDSGNTFELPFGPAPSYAGRLPTLFEKLVSFKAQGKRLIVASYQSDRLRELLNEHKIHFMLCQEICTLPVAGSITLIHELISSGWVFDDQTYLFTDCELFGFVKERRQARRRFIARRLSLPELKPGDYVVHIDHGVARFTGTLNMWVGGASRDYLLLEYAADDRLYVPTDQIDRVNRYIGSEDEAPTLNRLGTLEWARSKERAKEAAEETAAELIELYASRQIVQGYAFSPDTMWQRELEGSFPYVETTDQAKALEDVKTDMEKNQPMDRLILGDVGYGKTEVALRAAFKAVMDGKQVAVLVPTTVLAQQHYVTFHSRLAAFPIKLEVLSRFRSDKEQRIILDNLESGAVDVIIGTHRLLQPDVRFKKLGLLIVDEEQRFGVMHKEFIKRIRHDVDVLTLSATPIPRTLHLSLVGVRDMSVIETPPSERLPIKTFVASFDEHLVRESILKELERGGQVFFVHNRVQSIVYIAEKLAKLVPEATFIIGHGQMPEGELEAAMTRFAAGEVDVLVCTTIIESGLDVPNANTLIVNQADRFGLTQLYQLRGRVGRGSNLAYAYFLYDRGKKLTGDAEKRLRTIFEAGELGAGYSIAMKDLEIRGAGNLLGIRQSGHISTVGFNLYTRLLTEAIADLKHKKNGEESELLKSSKIPPPLIDLPLTAFIPATYIEDESLRLTLYQRLASVQSELELISFESELIDRFGQPPVEAQNLSYVIRIRLLGLKAGIKSISMESGLISISFFPGIRIDSTKLPVLNDSIRSSASKIWLDYLRLGSKWSVVLEELVWKLSR